jgi:hypothetical protein
MATQWLGSWAHQLAGMSGANAAKRGHSTKTCPYPDGSRDRAAWIKSYQENIPKH